MPCFSTGLKISNRLSPKMPGMYQSQPSRDLGVDSSLYLLAEKSVFIENAHTLTHQPTQSRQEYKLDTPFIPISLYLFISSTFINSSKIGFAYIYVFFLSQYNLNRIQYSKSQRTVSFGLKRIQQRFAALKLSHALWT